MTRLPTRSAPRRAITASGVALSGRNTEYAKRLKQPWQDKALYYYNVIGELRYASLFYAKQLARVRVFPALQKDDGTIDAITEGLPVELLARVHDPSGGRSALQYDYGRLMFITGEGVLFVTAPESERENWRFLWREEIGVDERTGMQFRKDAQGQKVPGSEGRGYRLWTPHPQHSDLPDSPIRAVIDIAEELVLLTAAVRATAISRLTSGLMKVPSELSLSLAETDEGEEDPEANVFLAKLIEHVEAAIDQPGSAAARVPVIIEGAYDYLDRLDWMKLHDPATDYMERDLRVEAIKRMALGLDMPPEALLGMTDANHWTAKQVQHDIWRSHGVVKAQQFVDDLNNVFMRPMLIDANYADAERVVLAFDDSQVVVSPDRTEDADNALDRAAIGFEAYRKLKGFDESMAPTEEEQRLLVAMKTRNPELIKEEYDIQTPEPAAFPSGPPPTANNARNAQDGPAPPRGGRLVSRQEARTASILGAAELAVRQCRAKAGARLRTMSKRPKGKEICPECLEQIDEVPNSVVASALGLQLLEQLGEQDPINLVAGGTDEFRGILEEWGLPLIQRQALCERIETYAASTLFEDRAPDLPSSFVSYVESAGALVD